MKRIINPYFRIVLFSLIFTSALFASEFTLEQYLTTVKQHSNDLKLAKKELDVAAQNENEAWALALPTIFAKVDYKRNLKDNFLFVEFTPGAVQKFKINRNNEFGAQAVLQQSLFSFKVNNALIAADQYQSLTSFIYSATELQILTHAKKSFYQAILLQKVLEVTRASANNAEENYNDLKKKFGKGVISELELLQAEVRWQGYLPQLSEAEKNYKLMVMHLKSFAGIKLDADLAPVGSLETYPVADRKAELGLVMANRPDFKALEWQKKLYQTNLKVNFAEHLPTLAGSLIYNYSAASDDFKLEQENHALIAGVTLSIPIFTGGYTSAQVQKAKIDLEKAELTLEKSRLDITQEISKAELSLAEALTRIESTKSTMKIAKKAFAIAELTAKNGLATQLELKDARLAFDQANLSHYAAVYDYLAAYFDWQAAQGRIE